MRTDLEFARFIDATLLKPEATKEEMIAHIESAKVHHFKTVAIGCAWIEMAAEMLDGTDVGIDAPTGFANGYNTTETKIFETKDAFAKGAAEADILLNIGWLRSGMYDKVENELKRFREACGDHVSKVILETYYLNEKEIREAVRIAKRADLNFVKTSTGFAKGGATEEAVGIMLDEAAGEILVKASGGIRSREIAEKYLDMGVMRLGASNPANMLIGK
jgi:deoxyribose-phosphate aldolase